MVLRVEFKRFSRDSFYGGGWGGGREILDAIWKNGKMWKIKDREYGSFRIVRMFGIVYSFTFDICDWLRNLRKHLVDVLVEVDF